jgi:hypothetical protein
MEEASGAPGYFISSRFAFEDKGKEVKSSMRRRIVTALVSAMMSALMFSAPASA